MIRRLLLTTLAVFLLAGAVVAWLDGRGDSAADLDAPAPAITPALVERGAYLALAGNCAGCHTARGGAPYAGGVPIETPFGTVWAGNLTPDDATGLGRWSAAQFRRALHLGRSADGRRLLPAFPYTEMTRVTRADADALHAYLRSLPAVHASNRPHELRFPFGTQAAIAVWRALFFRPGTHADDPAHSAEWNRGAYLVQGLAHCGACHGGRNALGGSRSDGHEFPGGMMPMRNWYAPSLNAADEAGVGGWPAADIAALLGTGRTTRGAVIGPMADVVWQSTQHLNPADLRAIAVYLAAVPQRPARGRERPPSDPAAPDTVEHGARIYADRCADCHGARGEGVAGFYPALAGNRTVRMEPPVNLVRAIVAGGFAPATRGNPRPFGMPPFGHVLSDAEIAAVATFLRASWGHAASPVDARAVQRFRSEAAP